MCQDDRNRLISLAAFVDEMHAKTVHVRAKVREAVHGLLLFPPVEAMGPVIDERDQFLTIRAESPAVVDLVGPACPAETNPKIIECGLRRADDKRREVLHAAPTMRIRCRTAICSGRSKPLPKGFRICPIWPSEFMRWIPGVGHSDSPVR